MLQAHLKTERIQVQKTLCSQGLEASESNRISLPISAVMKRKKLSLKNRNRNDPPWQSVHFIGAAGVGMFGLAQILLDLNIQVSGSDAAPSDNLDRLSARGARVYIGHDRANLGVADAAVYSSAIPENNPELTAAREKGIVCYRRGYFLAVLAEYFDTVITVAGSHGKTTTTAMLAHIFKSAGLAPGYLVGGDVAGWDSPAAAGSRRRILITEVDESDATQALIRSDYGLVTNIEDDHCWSVGGEQALFDCFVEFADKARFLLTWDTPDSRRLLEHHPAADFLREKDIPRELAAAVTGRHNQLNGALAAAAAERFGVSSDSAIAALADFPGVERRMSTRFRTPDKQQVIIEDYAHHPTELEATLQAVRRSWPEHHLTAIFQPHRFERVKRYAAAFRRILEQTADAAIVFRPFSAWVTDEQIADPGTIIEGIEKIPCRYWQEDFYGLAEAAVSLKTEKNHSASRVYVVLGAGDVNRVLPPLRNQLAEAWLENLQHQLHDAFPSLHQDFSTPWSALTSLGIGRARPLAAEPESKKELAGLLAWLAQHRIPSSVLGNGSNLVGSDNFNPSLTIRLSRGEFREITVTGDTVACGAGVSLSRLVDELQTDGPITPEFAPLAWIPASIGGAARMNAGCAGVALGDFIQYLDCVTNQGEKFRLTAENLEWKYRQVNLPDDTIITGVGFQFPGSDPARARQLYKEAGRSRHDSQPTGRTAGCVFRNPGETSAGKLIERCGLSGGTEGDCLISRTHANFIVNQGKGDEKDFITLCKRVLRRVYRRTGIRLLPEVCFIDSTNRTDISNAVPPLQLTVLAGGSSSERNISLRSGAAVADGLELAGHKVNLIDLQARELPELAPATNVVFPALHGSFGEDGQVQSLLEAAGFSYVGSGPEASRVMLDKAATKQKLRAADISTPAWWVLTDPAGKPPETAEFPLVIKPRTEGSSVGITRVERPGPDWDEALQEAFKYSEQILVEEFIEGKEITVAVLFGLPLPVIEIVPPAGHWFDFDAKYEYRHGHTNYLCPPQSIAKAGQEQAKQLATRAWQVLEAKDMARFDFIVDSAGDAWCLEVNTIPGFTQTSLLPRAARAADIGFTELCAALIANNLPGTTPELIQGFLTA